MKIKPLKKPQTLEECFMMLTETSDLIRSLKTDSLATNQKLETQIHKLTNHYQDVIDSTQKRQES